MPRDTVSRGGDTCDEPGCQGEAAFFVAHDKATFGFCTEHVWRRVGRWLNKLPANTPLRVSKSRPGAATNPG